ncbi:MAG: ArsC/Spx/MgsR family protein [Sulfuricellaceae bacterium]|jgi:nitrogenase-associated protein
MAKIIFYEKPGCGGNAKQKALLTAAGHELEVRDLLSHPWTASELMSFFGARPVADWFNHSAPRIKNGSLVPARMTAAEAIAALLADPLLIRRPLLESGDRREAGFDTALIAAWLGPLPHEDVKEGCPKGEEAKPCPPTGGPSADIA